MDELLAIIIIVILCCLMFFAWLLSMATCPDAMVALLSGTKADSAFSSSHESKELIGKQTEDKELGSSVSSVYLQMNAGRRTSDKKLSVVPEQDEQLTVQSTIQNMRPSILKIPQNATTRTPTVDETIEPSMTAVASELPLSREDVPATAQALPTSTSINIPLSMPVVVRDKPSAQEVL